MILCFALLGIGFAKLCSLQELIKFINCQHYSQDINKFTYLLLLVCSINQLISKLLGVCSRGCLYYNTVQTFILNYIQDNYVCGRHVM